MPRSRALSRWRRADRSYGTSLIQMRYRLDRGNGTEPLGERGIEWLGPADPLHSTAQRLTHGALFPARMRELGQPRCARPPTAMIPGWLVHAGGSRADYIFEQRRGRDELGGMERRDIVQLPAGGREGRRG